MKKVILARPSSLIVKDMKKLIASSGFEASPINELKELTQINQDEVAGIVISTALSSTVKAKYWEVIKRSIALFPGKPIFLASYATARSAKITAGSHIEEVGNGYELLSIEEAQKLAFDPEKHILILTQKEISDPVAFPSISELIKKVMKATIVL